MHGSIVVPLSFPPASVVFVNPACPHLVFEPFLRYQFDIQVTKADRQQTAVCRNYRRPAHWGSAIDLPGLNGGSLSIFEEVPCMHADSSKYAWRDINTFQTAGIRAIRYRAYILSRAC